MELLSEAGHSSSNRFFYYIRPQSFARCCLVLQGCPIYRYQAIANILQGTMNIPDPLRFYPLSLSAHRIPLMDEKHSLAYKGIAHWTFENYSLWGGGSTIWAI